MRETEFQEGNFSEDLEQSYFFFGLFSFFFFHGKVVLCITFVVISFFGGKEVLCISIFSIQ